jgi:hypothetical protein
MRAALAPTGLCILTALQKTTVDSVARMTARGSPDYKNKNSSLKSAGYLYFCEKTEIPADPLP